MPHPKPGRGHTGQRSPQEARQGVAEPERVQKPIARPGRDGKRPGGLRYPDATRIEMEYSAERENWFGQLILETGKLTQRIVAHATAKSYRSLGDQLARKFKKWLAEQKGEG